jgi:ABC-type transport system substrate-binding protein
LFPQGYKGSLSNPDYITEDLEKAKELLARAGYPDGFNTTIYADSGFDRDIVVAVQGMLGEIGINVEIEFQEPGAATQLRNSTGWEGLLIGTVRSLPNTTSTVRLNLDPTYQFFVSTWRPTEEMTPIYINARSTLTLQDDIMQNLSRLLLENMAVIPLYDTYDVFIIRDNVHDTGFAEWGANTWWLPYDAWKSSK